MSDRIAPLAYDCAQPFPETGPWRFCTLPKDHDGECGVECDE